MTLSKSFVVVVVACALVAGCKRNDAAIRVGIRVAANVKATCLRLVAVSSAGTEHISETFIRGTRADFVGAVFRRDDLEGEISLLVRGFVSEAGCSEPLFLNEESPRVHATFVEQGEPPLVAINLDPLSRDQDGDEDGYRPRSTGGPDCDDGDALTHPNAVERCSDTKDNDCNGKADCEDPACDRQTCTDQCTTGGTCSIDGGTCVGGTRVTCNMPPASCYQRPGTCNPLTGCMYTPSNAGIACPGPGGICQKDECDGTGRCLHLFQSPGTPCGPDNACASGYQCDPTGACANTMTTMCPPPALCFASAGCSADAGCLFTVTPDAPCDGGTCLPDGGCRTPPFPYNPSNFNPNAITSSGAQVVIDCPVTYDSTTAATPPRFCGAPQRFTATLIGQDGGPNAVVLAADRLTITPDGGIKLTGSLPVIFAIYGDATISGYINASATADNEGAGGSWLGCGGGDGEDGFTGTTQGSATGGGGAAYGTMGGDGGPGRTANVGGERGYPDGGRELIPLRGGCNGGNGGSFDGGAIALGGAGGGAIQLSAAGTLVVDGGIWAAGGGGAGGVHPDGGGGAGGGSGGAILLEANILSITSNASLTANGGGGGEGADQGAAGAQGSDGPLTSTGSASGGSMGTGNGGSGGWGGSRSFPPTGGVRGNGNPAGAAGGGGGSVGRIRVNAAAACSYGAMAVVSPAASSRQPDGGGCAP